MVLVLILVLASVVLSVTGRAVNVVVVELVFGSTEEGLSTSAGDMGESDGGLERDIDMDMPPFCISSLKSRRQVLSCMFLTFFPHSGSSAVWSSPLCFPMLG